MWISWWISGHCLFQEENSWCSHHNWTKSILNILMWEKTILCRRPKWACVPMKSHFSPQNSPRLIHRLFFFAPGTDKSPSKGLVAVMDPGHCSACHWLSHLLGPFCLLASASVGSCLSPSPGCAGDRHGPAPQPFPLHLRLLAQTPWAHPELWLNNIDNN